MMIGMAIDLRVLLKKVISLRKGIIEEIGLMGMEITGAEGMIGILQGVEKEEIITVLEEGIDLNIAVRDIDFCYFSFLECNL